MGGKLGSRADINAVTPGSLLHIEDQLTHRRFLCDTGASYSILPHHSSAVASGPSLHGPAGRQIKCWGERELTLTFNDKQYKWIFLLADVKFAIIGIDFLKHFKLVVDAAAGQLIDTKTMAIITAVPGAVQRTSGGLFCAVGTAPPAYRSILVEYQDVLNSTGDLPPPAHKVEHHLITAGRPVTARFRRLDPEKHEAAPAAFAKLERQGIIRRSNSCWASPLHMVKKADGSWRPCGDFRQLNIITQPDKYPLPRMDDLAGRLKGCNIFTKLDLKQGYHQIPMAAADMMKTAIITPFGLFEFTRMPFGLRNAGQSFQRMMDQVLAGLPFAFCYIDDILIASPDHASHQQDLRQVLDRLRQSGLVLNIEKCSFAQSSVDFLGHRVSAEGASPLQSHVAAVRDFPQPSTIKEVQGFLGMINFYRRFLPGIARTLVPLTDALKGGQKGPAAVIWTPPMQAAFLAAKTALCHASTLVHPDSAAPLSIMVDASATHVGAVLQQRRPGCPGWRPLGFYSHKLAAAQTRYSAFDRELFAVYSGIRYFRYMLEGQRFTVFTDHMLLTFALHKQAEPLTARQQRHLSYIAEFTSDIRHVAGAANQVADTLSRPPSSGGGVESPPRGPVRACRGDNAEANLSTSSGGLSSTVEALDIAGPDSCLIAAASSPVPVGVDAASIDFAAIAAAQRGCAATQQALLTPSLNVKTFEVEGVPLLCDTSTGSVRPLVPVQHRRLLFDAIHALAHPGTTATKRLLKARFVWPGMGTDIASWCRDCQHCQRGKVVRHVKAPVQPIAVPDRRFQHLHVDLVGPLPTSQEGFTHLLTILDRSTRWAEAIPMGSTSAQACADAVIGGWIARFGVPTLITSDRGPQFTGAVWSVLCHKLGIQHQLTTAYHPQSNGMVERFHRQLKDALRSRNCGAAWAAHLPWVLMGLRAAPKEDSGISSAELVYGEPMRLPGQPVLAAAPICEGEASPPAVLPAPPTRLYSGAGVPPVVPRQLEGATHVYVRQGAKSSPLSPPYSGPYVVRRRGPKSFDLIIGGRKETVSVDRLKLHRGRAAVIPAQPRRRGRPPLHQVKIRIQARSPSSDLRGDSCGENA